MITSTKKCINCGNKFSVTGIIRSVVATKNCKNCKKEKSRKNSKKWRQKIEK
jgi:hypothetical protein